MRHYPLTLTCLAMSLWLCHWSPAAEPAPNSASPTSASPTTRPAGAGAIRQGGEAEGIVQVANLIYAGTRSSKCFSDYFLIEAAKTTSISTSRRFHAVKLASDELFGFPFVIMTGEGTFELTDLERENLRKFVDGGGFVLGSAGCSSPEWDRSFRSEMARAFPQAKLQQLQMDHPVFHTVNDIDTLKGAHGTPRPLEGITLGDRLAVLYSIDGLNDTSHATGCCCCGGNEITNSIQINVNILAYALLH